MEPSAIIFGISIATILWIALRSSGRPGEGSGSHPRGTDSNANDN